MLQGPEIGLQIELAEEPIEIGRGDDATLRVDSDLVSRRHAYIQRLGTRYVIKDLDSTNGTYVNDERITTKRLDEGDLIKVGKVVLRYTESAVEAQYHEQILQQARVDALTGAYNKRHFDETFQRVVGQAQASRSALGLLLFDIDHFKQINDTYGHPAGDAVLRTFAEVVRGMLPDDAVFCRVGGEEFTIILPKAGLGPSRALAERIRVAVQGKEFSHSDQRIPVTVSLGTAELEAGSSTESFYRVADERLYAAKKGGRNQVC
jgi:diguanylate cyclase (GGDEF)-like protein